ncbi:hypothetical protein HNP11_000841 [Tsukamurella ocularis]|nr:hypothetical protein [Tsukamurella ocularis]MCS3786677.1 hypothetical protein [Tsukamurella ocularis]MCS3850519.1 hypothetical protein [Tsukamurella ocularis]
MNHLRTTPVRIPVEAAPPLVVHPRGGVVIAALLLLTLGLMIPLVLYTAAAPIG